MTFRRLISPQNRPLLHLCGLVIGLTAFFFIQVYIRYEKSYDRFHPHADRLYRVESRFAENGELKTEWGSSSPGYLTALMESVPPIEAGGRFWLWDSEKTLKVDDRSFHQPHVYFADPACLDLFHLPLLKGDAATALSEPNSVILTGSTAMKLYGKVDVLGEALEISDQSRTLRCLVTGVCQDLPGQSHLPLAAMVSWRTLLADQPWLDQFWYWHEAYTYVRLKPGQRPDEVEALFPAIAEAHKDRDALKAYQWRIELVPVTDIHLRPQLSYEREAKGSMHLVRGLSAVSWLLLWVTVFNFINLTTAFSADRIRNATLRRVLGASKARLFLMFSAESFWLETAALVFSAALAALFTKAFLLWCGEPLRGRLFLDGGLEIWLGLLAALVAAAAVPAWMLAMKSGVVSVRSQGVDSRWGRKLRSVLLFFQLATVLALIITAVLNHRQIDFMIRQPLGMKVERQLVLRAPVGPDRQAGRLEAFKTALLSVSGAKGMTVSSSVPGQEVGMFLANRLAEALPSENREYEMLRTDWDYFSVYGLKLLAGRSFERERGTDVHALVINETACRILGFVSPDQALGRLIRLEASETDYQIIGVAADCHHQSLKVTHKPVMFTISPEYDWIPTLFLTLSFSGDVERQLSAVQAAWSRHFPASALEYFLLEDHFMSQYGPDLRFTRVLTLFTGLVVFLAMMGLAGLTAAMLSARRKELALRRVLGAGRSSLLLIMSSGFYRLLAAAFLTAAPLAWVVAARLLQGFAFHIEPGAYWWVWGLSVAVIALLLGAVVTAMVWRQLHQNPAHVLHRE